MHQGQYHLVVLQNTAEQIQHGLLVQEAGGRRRAQWEVAEAEQGTNVGVHEFAERKENLPHSSGRGSHCRSVEYLQYRFCRFFENSWKVVGASRREYRHQACQHISTEGWACS